MSPIQKIAFMMEGDVIRKLFFFATYAFLIGAFDFWGTKNFFVLHHDDSMYDASPWTLKGDFIMEMFGFRKNFFCKKYYFTILHSNI